VAYTTAQEGIWLVGSDGSGAHQISAQGGIDVAWSPDGSAIRFSKDGRFWEITMSGSNLHEVLPGWHVSSSECCGRWTPDGGLFVFLERSRRSSSQGEIWALDERSGLIPRRRPAPIQLTTGPIDWGASVFGVPNPPSPAGTGRKYSLPAPRTAASSLASTAGQSSSCLSLAGFPLRVFPSPGMAASLPMCLTRRAFCTGPTAMEAIGCNSPRRRCRLFCHVGRRTGPRYSSRTLHRTRKRSTSFLPLAAARKSFFRSLG
jgi:hypothetical protein